MSSSSSDPVDGAVTVPPVAGEVAVLVAVQDAITDVPGVLPAATAMSFFEIGRAHV